jgi:hypothetical protein
MDFWIQILEIWYFDSHWVLDELGHSQKNHAVIKLLKYLDLIKWGNECEKL